MIARYAAAFSHFAGDADCRSEQRDSFGVGDCDLLRHGSLRRVCPRQLSAGRNNDGLALKAVTASAEQHIDHGEARAYQHHRACRGAALGRHNLEWSKRAGRVRSLQAKAVARITTSTATDSARSSSMR